MTSTTGPSVKRPARGRRAGFTLLELILVMMIICMVLAMAAPSLRGFFASRQTADAGVRIVALAEYARAQSAAQGRCYRLNMDAKEGTYWLTVQRGGAFVRLESEFGRTFHLPEGTEVSWEDDTEAEAGHLDFYPDGRTRAATIQLKGLQGERVDVTCESPSERFRVVQQEQEVAK
jgi:type II secretion system protein H